MRGTGGCFFLGGWSPLHVAAAACYCLMPAPTTPACLRSPLHVAAAACYCLMPAPTTPACLRSPLHVAAAAGRADVVEQLLYVGYVGAWPHAQHMR